MQSVPITTNIVSLNPAHVKVYSIQHYEIKFVSDLRQVCGFLLELWSPPSIKLTPTIVCHEMSIHYIYFYQMASSEIDLLGKL
jgi:hypothetical protein